MNSKTHFKAQRPIMLMLAILLIGACLRAPFTSLGPLLEMIREALGLSTAATGFVNTLPLLAFALVSPAAPLLSRRLGLEPSLLLALVLIAGGVALRTMGAIWSLYLGTGCIGCGIAMGNVLLPSLVKRDFPDMIPRVTAQYALSMGVCAALGSIVVAPLAQSLNLGWELASGSIILLPLAACLAWLPQFAARNTTSTARGKEPEKVSLWTSALAWQVTLFFGLTSLTYYISVSWLPSLLRTEGFTEVEAGNIHGLMQFASALPGLVLAPAVNRMKDQRLIAAGIAAVTAVGMAGMAALPKLAILWSSCIGFGTGAAIILGLMFIGLRTSSVAQAASLSGMAQSVGYLLAATGPIWAGALHDAVNNWSAVFFICALLCVLLGLAGWGAGRDMRIQDKQR